MDLFPVSASTYAEGVDALALFLFGMAGFMSMLIALAILFFAFRYRRRAKIDRSNAPTTAHKMEIVWTVIPLAVSLFIFFWSAKLYVVWASPPADSLEVYGVGKQWMWKFQHTEGNREINE